MGVTMNHQLGPVSMSPVVSERIYQAQKRWAKRGHLQVTDIDPMAVRRLILSTDWLDNRLSLRRAGEPLRKRPLSFRPSKGSRFYLV